MLSQTIRRTSLVALTVILAAMAPTAVASDASRTEVERAVLDYVEAIEQGRPELIERSVHPELAKFGFSRREANDDYRIIPMTFERLVEIATEMKAKGYVPEAPQHSVEILDMLDQTASVKLTAFWGTDYMHLAKYDGKWKIVQVLWQSTK